MPYQDSDSQTCCLRVLAGRLRLTENTNLGGDGDTLGKCTVLTLTGQDPRTAQVAGHNG